MWKGREQIPEESNTLEWANTFLNITSSQLSKTTLNIVSSILCYIRNDLSKSCAQVWRHQFAIWGGHVENFPVQVRGFSVSDDFPVTDCLLVHSFLTLCLPPFFPSFLSGRLLLCFSGWPITHHVDQAGIKLSKVSVPLSLEGWD